MHVLVVIILIYSSMQKSCGGYNFHSNYVSVMRKTLTSGSIVSIFPANEKQSQLTENSIVKPNAISDVIFVPSFLDKQAMASDPATEVLRDDHLASLLCDEGFTVHVLCPKDADNIFKIQKDSISWLLRTEDSIRRRVNLKSIALVGLEISCMSILSLLSETLYPICSGPLEIGAVVLVDCPPVHASLSLNGRQTILHRYFEPLLSIQPETIQKCVEKIKNTNAFMTKKKKKIKSWKQRLKNGSKENQSSDTGEINSFQALLKYYLSKGFTETTLLELLNDARVSRKSNDGPSKFESVVLNFPTNENAIFRTIEEERSYETLVFSADMLRRFNKLQRKSDIYKTEAELDEETMLENMFLTHNKTMTNWLSGRCFDDITLKLVPRCPSNLYEIGARMQKKFLLIATEEMKNMNVFCSSGDPRDGWGVEAIQELADILQSSVMFCDSGNVDDIAGNVIDTDLTYSRNSNLAKHIGHRLSSMPDVGEK